MTAAVRTCAGFTRSAVIVTLTLLLLSAAAPAALGYRSFTVLTGSMVPTLRVGDVVVEQAVRPEQVRVGDIVTFRDPARRGRLITHRVTSIAIRGGQAAVHTKGDANTAGEEWSIATTEQLGRVVRRVPAIGYIAVTSMQRAGRVICIVIPAVVLAAWALVAIWRPRRPVDASVA
jgi:signal peptidase